MNDSRPTEGGARPARRSLLVILPLVTFAILAGLFYVRLRSGVDPAAIPSALVGRKIPDFRLEPVAGLTAGDQPVPGLSSTDLQGHVTVLNFWASWCAPCEVEHPLLMRLSREPGIRLVGIDYKDTADRGKRFLERHGVPFAAIGSDESGRVGIDFGVYGVPETFIIGPDGVIRHKLVGILSAENYAAVLDKVRSTEKFAEASR